MINWGKIMEAVAPCPDLRAMGPYLRSSYTQRCRSVFNIGGIIPHFYRFFGILKFWGDIQVLSIFQVLKILKIWGYIQVLTKMYLNNWKYVLECIKSINDEGTLCSQITIYMFSDYTSYCWANGHRLHQFPEEIKETTIEVRSTADL